MSTLIQQFNSLRYQHHKVHKILKPKVTSKKTNPFIQDLQNFEQKFENRLQLNFLGQRELFEKDIIINLDAQISKSEIKIQVFYAFNNLPLKARSNQFAQGLISKKILRYNCQMPNLSHMLCIDRAKITKVVAAFKYTQDINYQPYKLRAFLKIIIKETRQLSKSIFFQALQWMNLLQNNHQKIKNPRLDHNNYLQKADIHQSMIVKYIEASTFAPQFLNLGENDEKDRKQLANLHKVQRTWSVDDILDLYTFNPEKILKTKLQFCDFKISLDEVGRMKTRLEFPAIARQVKRRQSPYIFNYIKVQNPQKIEFFDQREGGSFSNIRFSKITFCCIETSVALGNKVSGPNYTGPITKHICFKYPKNEKQQNRLNHQIQILSRFKGSICHFLLKYYHSTQQKFPYKNNLMSDAYRQPTMHQYMFKNKNTATYYTKCHYLIQLAQALRFLRNYQIAHLDIKPNNMFIQKQGLLKLFDFGQSYHKQVCKEKDFFPGFTLPYTAPQYFKGVYSCQNDIFAFGMMMLETFYKPVFSVKGKKLLNIFKEQTYHKRMFIVDEQLDAYCQRKIIYCLFHLINKCLNKDPAKRPNPAWIIIVLVQLLIFL